MLLLLLLSALVAAGLATPGSDTIVAPPDTLADSASVLVASTNALETLSDTLETLSTAETPVDVVAETPVVDVVTDTLFRYTS